MNKRTTIVIAEYNWKHFEQLKAQKLMQGKGDLSFTSYVNACLGILDPTVDQLIEELKRIKKEKE